MLSVNNLLCLQKVAPHLQTAVHYIIIELHMNISDSNEQ